MKIRHTRKKFNKDIKSLNLPKDLIEVKIQKIWKSQFRAIFEFNDFLFGIYYYQNTGEYCLIAEHIDLIDKFKPNYTYIDHLYKDFESVKNQLNYWFVKLNEDKSGHYYNSNKDIDGKLPSKLWSKKYYDLSVKKINDKKVNKDLTRRKLYYKLKDDISKLDLSSKFEVKSLGFSKWGNYTIQVTKCSGDYTDDDLASLNVLESEFDRSVDYHINTPHIKYYYKNK